MNVLTIRSDTLFGKGNEIQNRNNENTQQKSLRITDGIKKELFPSCKSLFLSHLIRITTYVMQDRLHKLMKKMTKTNNTERDQNYFSRILWQNASPANF
jgi:hypothetical protein